MQEFVGIIKGTAATLTPCIGFEPDLVEVDNLTDRTRLIWRPEMVGVLNHRFGMAVAAAGTRTTVSTAAYGVVPYAGGTQLSAASTQYLVQNDADQRAVDVAAGLEVDTFTLDTAANFTGHFNCDVTGATIGLGSRITFAGDPKFYTIIALTAGQGIASDEVGLDASPGAGAKKVTRITSIFALTGAPSGVIAKAGFTIGASATVNDTDGDILLIRAVNSRA